MRDLLLRDHVVSQTVRHLIVGAATGATYLGLTLLLAGPVGVPLLAAVVAGYVVAVSLHFTLQRTFVFRRSAYALPLRDQLVRYAMIGAAQLALTAATTTLLPPVVHISPEVIYVTTVASMTLVTFVLMRLHVFHGATHPAAGGTEAPPAPPAPPAPAMAPLVPREQTREDAAVV